MQQAIPQVEQAAQRFVDTEPIPVITVATAPAILPTLALIGIGVGLGLLAGIVYTALTPQNLASGTIAPVAFNPPSQNGGNSGSSSSGFNPPSQNNTDPSPPQTQAGGSRQQPPKGPPPTTTSPQPQPRKLGGGFRTDKKLQGHYGSHNSEFDPPFVSPEHYEAVGLRFMQGDLPEGSLQGRFIKGYYEGDIVRYNTITNEFGMLTKDSTLRSYYLPEERINEFWKVRMPNGSLELP